MTERTAEVIKDLLYLMQVEAEGPQPDDASESEAWLRGLEVDFNYWTKQFFRHYEPPSADKANA